MIRFVIMLTGRGGRRWDLARQMGFRQCTAKLHPSWTGSASGPEDWHTLEEAVDFHLRNGFELIGLEGDQFDFNAIKLGLPERDRAMATYVRMIENMGRAGLTLLNYNWSPLGPFRTVHANAARGGARSARFILAEAEKLGVPEFGPIAADKTWDDYQWFIEQALPAAESAGVTMCLHPDDPPLPMVRGVACIMTSLESMDRVLAISHSPSHKLTLCQGCYTGMGIDVAAAIRKYGSQGRIGYAHFRNQAGSAEDFWEVFPDDAAGNSDMVACAEAYRDVGYSAWMRSDHAQVMAGDEIDALGKAPDGISGAYSPTGSVFSNAYMIGLFQGVGYPLQR